MTEPEYTCVLMQGSGTFGVESVLTSCAGPEDCLLIASNGAYGDRMADIARHAGIPFIQYCEEYDRVPSADRIRGFIQKYPEITHVCMVHSETTSGILNDIASVAKAVKEAGRVFIVDAMSSFGGVDIPWFIETEDKPLLFNIQTGGELEIVPRICPILPCVVPLHAV